MFSNRKLLVQSSILYFPKLISWIGSYLAFSLLFRVRGAEEYGNFVLLTAYWGIPALIAGDIVGSSCQRLIAQVTATGGPAVNRAFQSLWTIHALAVVGIGLTAALALPFMNRVVFKNPALEEHLALGLIIYVGSASLGFFRYILRGMQLFRQTLSMDMTESIVRNLLWIACCTGYAFGMSLAQAAAIALMAAALVVYGALFRRGFYPSDGKIDPIFSREIGLQAKSFALIFICNYVLNSLPAIVLNRYHGAEAVGLFSALFRIVDFSTGPIVAMAYILAPVATGAKLKGEQEVRGLLTRSFKISILFLPMIVCMAICRTEIVNLFGLSKYPEAPAILLAFCVFVFFSNISAIFGSFADFLGYAHARARLMALFSGLFGVGVWFLAKDGSVLQVAWATTIAYGCTVSSYLGLIVYHHSGRFMRENLGLLLRMVACLLAAAMIARFFLPLPEASGFRENIVSLLIRSLAFGGLTALFGALVAVRRVGGKLTIR